MLDELDDPDAALVFADVLQQRGDPRGELIAVQHELAITETAALRHREAELFAAHGEAFLGGLHAHREAVALRWARGFIVGAQITGPVATMHAVLPILLAAPYVRDTLGALRLGPAQDLEMGDHVLATLGDGWPRALRALVVDVPAIKLGWASAPPLRHLTLRSACYPDTLEKCAWPALETFEVWHKQAHRTLGYLEADRFPALRSLALVGAAADLEVAELLADAPITTQLAALDLRGGLVARAGAQQLAGLPATIRHLDVRGNVLGRDEVRALVDARAALGGTVASEPQRRPIKNDPNRALPAHSLLDRRAISELVRRFERAFDESRADIARTCVELLELVDAGAPQRQRLAQALAGRATV